MNKMTDKLNTLIGGQSTPSTIGKTPVVAKESEKAVVGRGLKDATASQANVDKNNKIYKSLQSKGKSYGSGFGG